jgi:hypothetical protein
MRKGNSKYKQNWSTISKEWTTPDIRYTPSTTNLEKKEIVDAPGNDGNASRPEQVKRSNSWRKMMMIRMWCDNYDDDAMMMWRCYDYDDMMMWWLWYDNDVIMVIWWWCDGYDMMMMWLWWYDDDVMVMIWWCDYGDVMTM